MHKAEKLAMNTFAITVYKLVIYCKMDMKE